MLQWGQDVDATAVALAAKAGYYPEKTKGGVSRFLADLVAAAARKRNK